MASRPPERAAATAEAGAAEPIVALRGITKRFPGVVANDDVSLSVYPAEVHALLGENGAGKSTLISILSGMQRPDRGTIEVRGRAMRIASPRTALDLGIGTVYQHPTLVPTLTVLENLMLGASWRAPMNRAATRARLNEIAALLGIALPEDTPLGALSLGQQQLVEIVKALWRGEKVLILDEATSMLTPQGVEDLGRVIGRLRDAGIAVLFITHKLHEAVRFGDRVSVLRQGRKVGSLPPETLGRLGPQEAIDHIVDLMFGQAADRSGAERRRAQREAAPGEREVIAVDGLRPAGGPAAAGDDGVTFAVHEREIFGIAGVDGNGQKQLAEAIAGQRPAEAGRIVLDGTPIEGLSVRRRQHAGLRYVTDDRLGEGTVAAFPVGLNLLLKRIGDAPFWRHGIVRNAEVERHARTLIAEHDVRVPGPGTPLGHLSGGNVQKALLARELDNQPMAVIYNKPTYGLDLNNIRRARRAICARADQGVATILISTDLDEIIELADRIGVMLDGRMVGIVANDGDAARRVGELMIGVGTQT